jgi:hypothetical protein
MDEAFITLWVLLSIPLLWVALYPVNALIGNVFRERRHRMVRDVLNERLDVLKTAIAMGFKEDDLMLLDERLEQLVGREKLEQLLVEERGLSAARRHKRDHRDALATSDLEEAVNMINKLKQRKREGDQ